MTETKKKLNLPFKIVESEVSGGFIDSVHTAFTGGIDVANYHEDKYGNLEETTLQSPFTERWVGGKSYRHVEIGTPEDERPEAWHLDFVADGVRFYSHNYRSSPPAYWSRQGLAKRPLNVANIKNTGPSLGNYSSNYEVVQSSGRRITNNLIVDGYQYESPLTTQFVSPQDFTLPELDSVTGSKSIFVERFNSPGSKEESTRRALDHEGEEMSPNIPLPFRSHYIRKEFNSNLQQSTPQFGGTIHGVNRNTLIRAGNTQQDNGFVVHSLPRTDIQYSWITASAYTTADQLGGYQSFGDSYNRSEAFTDIDFISGSLVAPEGTEIEVDNFFINSQIKDKKKINLNTRTIYMSSSLSASMSEYTNSPYTFGTWTSLRTSEHQVARRLRANSIISVQDEATQQVSFDSNGRRPFTGRRGEFAKNYVDPPVTFKYRPLRHKFIFVGNNTIDLSHDVVHTYANNISTFANKDLLTRLKSPEDKPQFYDLIYQYYADPDSQENNPIERFVNFKYKEIVWPREENTGLARTRGRTAYYLDKPGFSRDGYDRQLGTQRAFWRDNQEDRKRSSNSDGGYYSSMNYLSTEESGSSFNQSIDTISSDNKFINISSSYVQDLRIDEGFLNSVLLLEQTSPETQKSQHKSSISASAFNSYLLQTFKFGDLNKRTFSFETSGEFNSVYNDFYEQIKIEGEQDKRSIGAIYRNTSNKQLLTKQNQADEVVIRTEDDEAFINPKLKFCSFVGGTELNTGSYFQNSDNFTSNFESIEGVQGNIRTFYLDGDYLYVGGSLKQAGHIKNENLVRFNLNTEEWDSLGIPAATHSAMDVRAIYKYGDELYVGGVDFLKSYNFTTGVWSELGTGLVPKIAAPYYVVYDIEEYGGNIYVAGQFSSAGGISNTSNIAYWDAGGGSWNNLDSFDSINDTIYSLEQDYVNEKLYIGGQFKVSDGSVANYIAVYNLLFESYDGALSTEINSGIAIVTTVLDLKIDGSTLYVGGNFTNAGGVTLATGVAKYDISSSSWSALGSAPFSTGNPIASLELIGGTLYAGGLREFAKYTPVPPTWTNYDDKIGSGYVFAVSHGQGKIYVGGNDDLSFRQYGFVYDPSLDSFGPIRTNSDFSLFDSSLFSQTLAKQDVVFSTMDSGLVRYSDKSAPFFDSYEQFGEDIKRKAKEFSVFAEFNISNNMKNYVEEMDGDFLSRNTKFLECDGQEIYDSSDNTFVKNLSMSDVLKKHDEIKQENSSLSLLEKVSINVSGLKKLLPKNGFYPQERVVQMANLYNDYVVNNLEGGSYSAIYNTDFEEKQIFETTSIGKIDSISSVFSNNKFFVVIGKSIDGNGKVEIYSSSADEIDNFSLMQELDNPTGINSGADIGRRVSIVSASNGLNIFASSDQAGTTSEEGYVLHSVLDIASNQWSALSKMSVYGTSDFISGSQTVGRFGDYFDLHYDEQEEKIIMAIGEPRADVGVYTEAGNCFIITGSLVDNEWRWSNKTKIAEGTIDEERVGTGVSIVKLETNTQVYIGAPRADGSSFGRIYYTNSSDLSSWSPKIYIVQSDETHTNQGHGIGANNLKATNFNDRTFVFYTEPGKDYEGIENTGVTHVISSSLNNVWGGSNIDSQKTLIYSSVTDQDLAPNEEGRDGFQVFNENNKRLQIAIVNSISPKSTREVAISSTTDGINWKTSENNKIARVSFSELHDLTTIGIAKYKIASGEELPVFLYSGVTDASSNKTVRKITNNQFINYSIIKEEDGKTVTQAALEPIMAPGIIYNTIKSGIAVDWPCITGSQTSIQPYGEETIVNAYYPAFMEMARHSGSNIVESAYGNLRSIIDYRVPFENVIFPNETFSQKSSLTSSLITQTIETQLESTDPVAQFLNGTYVYGGYEPYVSPLDYGDVNALGPKRFSVPFVYRKLGSKDSRLYSLAMSNFLAETVKFFLKDEKMITFTSSPDNQWYEFNSDKTYYMDVVLEKTDDLVMMEAYHSDLHPTGSNGEKMNGRYFGYPTNKTTKEIWGTEEFTAEERRLIHNDPAYAPYTPPYFEGQSRARISFKPDATRSYYLTEVFENATVENIFAGLEDVPSGADAKVHKMPVGSSVELFGFANPVQVSINEQTGERTIANISEQQAWVISPKMETPVLDFSSQELVSHENNYSKASGFGRGMWSGYGKIPANGAGVKMRLEYPFRNVTNATTGSLLDVVNFREEEKSVGQLADRKQISEAVVLVPYLERATDRTTQNTTGFNFIKLNREIFASQYMNIKAGRSAVLANTYDGVTEDVRETSISQMIQKMEKYVIPPEMNFLQYPTIEPFVMYLFEFEHDLDRQDLADIWQGVMPKIAKQAELDKVTIEHSSNQFEFFEGKELPDNLRWLVFKVKRKAEINYFNVTKDTKDDDRFDFNKIIGREEGTDVYSYNWPYDYFSLVETAKVEIELEYKNKENEE